MRDIEVGSLYPQRSAEIMRVDDTTLSLKGTLAQRGEVWRMKNRRDIMGEVSATSRDGFVLSLYNRTENIIPGSRMEYFLRSPVQKISEGLLGRVLDGMGHPVDGGPEPQGDFAPVELIPVNPLEREIIETPLETGVRAIDGFITVGRGQKIGLFAPSGVGKSVLMGMIARGTNADVRVIAMIGERGREVREFIESSLGEAKKDSVVFVSPSDSPPLTKLSGLQRAIATARYFADQGRHVLLLVDSLTRVATALRDLGLASGEAPVTRGYTPSMYNYFPTILEQAGNFPNGSLTMIATVLVEEGEDTDPVATTARSILDGHIVLSQELARVAHYPAIDVLRSKSRVMTSVVDKGHRYAYQKVMATWAMLKEYEDVVNMGLYRKGTNPELDLALAIAPNINVLLRQDMDEITPFIHTKTVLEKLANEIENAAKA